MDFIRYAMLGMGTGSIYAMVSAGLVTVYRGSGIVNFSQGAFVMAGGYIDYEFTQNMGWNFWPAMIMTVILTASLGALVQIVVFEPMKDSSPLTRVVVTLGLLITFQAAAALHYGHETRTIPSYLPTRTVHVLPNVAIGLNVVIIFLVGLGASVLLWTVYRFTSFGRLTAAVAENQRAFASLGRSPQVVAVANWMIGAGLAGLAGVLVAPITFLEPNQLALLVVPAIAAALVGNFSSFPLAFVGALVIGAGESLCIRYITNPGWSQSLAFLIIILVVLIRGRGLPLRSFVLDRLPAVGNGRIRYVPVAIAYVALMWLFGSQLELRWILPGAVTLIAMIFCLSILVVTGYGGQLSLAQYVIGGVAAFVAAKLTSPSMHWPFVLAAVVGILAAIGAGALMGIPALRTRGMTLAIVTLGLAVVLYSLVLNNLSLNGSTSGLTVKPPSIFGWDISPLFHQKRFAMVVITLLFVVALAVANVRRGAAGRRMLAVRSNERAATAVGLSVYEVKLYAFMLAAGVAGIGGILYAFMSFSILPGQFDQLSSINYVSVSVVGGTGFVGGTAFGALLIPDGFFSQVFRNWSTFNSWLPLIGGLSVIFVLRANQSGLWATNRDMAVMAYRSVAGRFRRKDSAATASAADDLPDAITRAEEHSEMPSDAVIKAAAATAVRVAPKTLRVEDLVVKFGGVTAVASASLEVAPGLVTGLIGPNGAGKTTFIDAVTGFVKPTSGSISFDDVRINGWRAQRRATGGLSRSFQSVELFAGLTVRENLAVASDAGRGRHQYLTDLVYPGRMKLSAAAEQAIVDFGLVDDLDTRADSLPFGRRRLVAIARAVASEPSVLLLDEPAAGLDDTETRELSVLVRSLARDWGIAVLLVEHNLEMVLNLCDTVTVLVNGSVLFRGTPDEVREHPGVLAAYIGTHGEDDRSEPSRATKVIKVIKQAVDSSTVAPPPH